MDTDVVKENMKKLPGGGPKNVPKWCPGRGASGKGAQGSKIGSAC